MDRPRSSIVSYMASVMPPQSPTEEWCICACCMPTPPLLLPQELLCKDIWWNCPPCCLCLRRSGLAGLISISIESCQTSRQYPPGSTQGIPSVAAVLQSRQAPENGLRFIHNCRKKYPPAHNYRYRMCRTRQSVLRTRVCHTSVYGKVCTYNESLYTYRISFSENGLQRLQNWRATLTNVASYMPR